MERFSTEAESGSRKTVESLIEDFKDILIYGRDFPTIDIYLYSLSLNDSENFTRKKAAISVIFLFYHYINTQGCKFQCDPRYLDFLGTLNSAKNQDFRSIPITLLVWNYDIQIELAYYKLFNEKRMSKLRECLGMTNRETSQKFNFARLNGSIIYHEDLNLQTTNRKEMERKGEDFNNRLINILLEHYEEILYDQKGPHMRFHWEGGNGIEQTTRNIEESLRSAEELVVCGYSFPRVNRLSDINIIDNMKSLRKITLQYKYDDESNKVKNLLLNIITNLEDWPERKKWIEKSKNSVRDIFHFKSPEKEFYIPDDYIT